jgi:L-fuconolactonase
MTLAIDAHQHFWTLARGDYGWLTPALAPLYRDFGPADLRPLLAEAGIARTILVQAAPTIAETRFMLDIARDNDFVAGVVGWVDMEANDAPAQIAALQKSGPLCGIRPMIHDIADPQWMLRRSLERAFRAIIDADLTFDALVRPVHLPYLIRLRECYPTLRMVVDHGAKPDIARWTPGDAAFNAWHHDMATLGQHNNTFCKMSGLVTEARPDWEAPFLFRYFDALSDAFTPHRLLWGSDWPVVNLAGGYRAWRDASMSWLILLRRSERIAILGGTAARAYRLKEDAAAVPPA